MTPDEYRRAKDPGTLGLALPVIVKPNYEGSSKGIGDEAVVRDARALAEVLPQALRAYPTGVLVEEFVAGTDVTVPFLEGRGDEGVLLPVDYLVDPSARSRFNLYDYRLKSAEANKVSVRCPPDLPRDVVSRLRAISKQAVRALGVRDLGRIDFRVGEDGRLYLLEVNALPSLEPGASLYAAAAREGLDFGETLHAVVESAARRQGLVVKPGARRRRPADPLRIGFTFNVKRVDPKAGNDAEAEYDAPETIDAIREALEHYGHVTLFEADAELPRHLMQTPVDLVFNIAEGVAGRNREAAVPALCELMGIPYTGSDAATLSIALDKALSKRVLLQHEILTAEFQVMETGRERLSSKLKFPLIVKPNQEGSSKGVSASASVCDNEESLRAVVRELIDRYRQPALIEVYIPGREFTVGLLGDRRPARAAADGDPVQGQEQHAARLRLPDQAGVGEARLLPMPGAPVADRAEGGRTRLPRDLRGARLPRRRARRPAHDAEGRHLRHRGEPAAGADARLLGPVPDRAGGRASSTAR